MAARALDRTRALIDSLRAIDASAWRDLDAVLDAVADELRVLLDADHAGVQLRVPGTDEFVRRRGSPLADEGEVFEPGRRFRPDALARQAINENRAIFTPDFQRDERVDPAVRAALSEVVSSMAAPLTADEETVGFMFAHWLRPYAEQPGDAEAVRLLALHAGLVVRVAGALDNARRAQAEAERAHDRAAFLSAASATLASSLDYEATLGRVAHLLVPRVADWCAIDLLDEAGGLRRIAAVHADPARAPAAMALRAEFPRISSDVPHTAQAVLRTGQSWIDPTVSPARLAAEARSPEHLALLRELGFGSEMVVALRARERVLGTITLVAAEPGRFGLGDLALAEEVADRAALAIDNARLYKTAQDAIAAREEFLGVAAHELRTPVTSLRGFAQLAGRMLRLGVDDPARLQAALGQVDAQSKRLTALVDQLLDVARLDSGRLVIERRPGDLNALVEELIGRLRAVHADHPIVVQRPDGELAVAVDPLRIEQVVTNLVDNAAKFSPPDAEIEVLVAVEPGWAVVSVRDHGVGIPSGDHQRIFERFVQVHADRHYGGMGVGLYVSRQIVELHGGTIAAESPPGGGTRLVVRLPRA